jgi:hypothetical protein
MYVVLTDEEIQCEMIGVYQHKLDAYIEELKEENRFNISIIRNPDRIPKKRAKYKRRKKR